MSRLKVGYIDSAAGSWSEEAAEPPGVRVVWNQTREHETSREVGVQVCCNTHRRALLGGAEPGRKPKMLDSQYDELVVKSSGCSWAHHPAPNAQLPSEAPVLQRECRMCSYLKACGTRSCVSLGGRVIKGRHSRHCNPAAPTTSYDLLSRFRRNHLSTTLNLQVHMMKYTVALLTILAGAAAPFASAQDQSSYGG